MLYCFNSSHLLIMSSLDINIVDVLFAHLSYRLSIFKALIYLHVLFSSVFCYAYIPCKKKVVYYNNVKDNIMISIVI
jgi:hypothetical protein